MFGNSYTFEDKIAVITGAGSGIGRATAKALAKKGGRVHLADIDGDRVESACNEIRENGGSAESHVVDCSDADAVKELADSVFRLDGRVNILHNNAGIGIGGRCESLSIQDWKKVIDINLWGVIYGIHEFLPRMLEQDEDAHIVNTASGLGLVTAPYLVPYVTTKFAVVGLTEALSIEYGERDVNFSVICPGLINTNIVEDSDTVGALGERQESIEQLYERVGASPDEVAESVLQAIRKKKVIQLSPVLSVLIPWLLRRLSPALYRSVIGRMNDWFLPDPGKE